VFDATGADSEFRSPVPWPGRTTRLGGRSTDTPSRLLPNSSKVETQNQRLLRLQLRLPGSSVAISTEHRKASRSTTKRVALRVSVGWVWRAGPAACSAQAGGCLARARLYTEGGATRILAKRHLFWGGLAPTRRAVWGLAKAPAESRRGMGLPDRGGDSRWAGSNRWPGPCYWLPTRMARVYQGRKYTSEMPLPMTGYASPITIP